MTTDNSKAPHAIILEVKWGAHEQHPEGRYTAAPAFEGKQVFVLKGQSEEKLEEILKFLEQKSDVRSVGEDLATARSVKTQVSRLEGNQRSDAGMLGMRGTVGLDHRNQGSGSDIEV